MNFKVSVRFSRAFSSLNKYEVMHSMICELEDPEGVMGVEFQRTEKKLSGTNRIQGEIRVKQWYNLCICLIFMLIYVYNVIKHEFFSKIVNLTPPPFENILDARHYTITPRALLLTSLHENMAILWKRWEKSHLSCIMIAEWFTAWGWWTTDPEFESARDFC